MGIVVELDRSYAKFQDPGLGGIGFDLRKVFQFKMHSWEIQFGVRFDPDPTVGVGGAPSHEQRWRLGIVQNVLFERLLLVYEDAAGRQPPQNLQRQQQVAAIDMITGSAESPFYNSKDMSGNKLATRPVERIVYSAKGYREAASAAASFSNSPSTFSMWDQPETNIPFGRDPSFRLRRIEKRLIFQAWLVAENSGPFDPPSSGIERIRQQFIPAIIRDYDNKYKVLASIPAFSTTFWADIDLAGFRPRSSIDTPTVAWGLYGSEGFFPHLPIDRRITQLGASPSPKPELGDGKRFPTLSGQPSIKATDEWFESVGIHL